MNIGDDMQRIRKLFSPDKSAADILMSVEPINHGGFGVYANNVLIAIHTDQAFADAHYLRLRNHQAIW
jgi:hypothetical protein